MIPAGARRTACRQPVPGPGPSACIAFTIPKASGRLPITAVRSGLGALLSVVVCRTAREGYSSSPLTYNLIRHHEDIQIATRYELSYNAAFNCVVKSSSFRGGHVIGTVAVSRTDGAEAARI